jgi:hypothetical protein
MKLIRVGVDLAKWLDALLAQAQNSRKQTRFSYLDLRSITYASQKLLREYPPGTGVINVFF